MRGHPRHRRGGDLGTGRTDRSRGAGMTGRLEGQVALVTGAASGIGAAIAARFVEEGSRCVLGDIADDAGREGAARLGDAATYVHADVSDEDQVAAAVGAAVDS